MPTPRINGGIITDQMLTGSLLYFKMTGAFAYTVSDGTVTLLPSTSGGTSTTYYNLVGVDRPVPGSLADDVLRVLSERCTIVDIGVIGAPGSETAIHMAISGTAFGWIDATGAVDVTAMEDAVTDTLGANVTVPTTSGGAVDDNTVLPETVSRSTAVTIVETTFELA